MPVIRIPQELFQRLGQYAKGFDTPSNVIERLLNEKEGIVESSTVSFAPESLESASKPELVFQPNEPSFKRGLIQRSPAKVTLTYIDGSFVEKLWSPTRFTESSNLRANIWSGYLRGWKDEGIVKAEFALHDRNEE